MTVTHRSLLHSDWDVYQNCSPDAYYYLLFHTYLIGYLLFVTIFSLSIILPVNFQGTQGELQMCLPLRHASFLSRNNRAEVRTHDHRQSIA